VSSAKQRSVQKSTELYCVPVVVTTPDLGRISRWAKGRDSSALLHHLPVPFSQPSPLSHCIYVMGARLTLSHRSLNIEGMKHMPSGSLGGVESALVESE